VSEPSQDAAQDLHLASRRSGAREQTAQVALDALEGRVAGEVDAGKQAARLLE